MAIGDICPRHSDAVCFHRHLCLDGCIEMQYDQERRGRKGEVQKPIVPPKDTERT